MSAGVRFERLHADATLPQRATAHAAGYDLRAYLTGTAIEVWASGEVTSCHAVRDGDVRDGTPHVAVPPGARAKIPLGFRSELPPTVEAQVRPRSGTSFRSDLAVANSPGTIDADYRGEWMVLVRNLGSHPLRVFHGDAIAQVVFAHVLHPLLEEGPVSETARGAGGFGSTDTPPPARAGYDVVG